MQMISHFSLYMCIFQLGIIFKIFCKWQQTTTFSLFLNIENTIPWLLLLYFHISIGKEINEIVMGTDFPGYFFFLLLHLPRFEFADLQQSDELQVKLVIKTIENNAKFEVGQYRPNSLLTHFLKLLIQPKITFHWDRTFSQSLYLTLDCRHLRWSG